MSRSKSYLDSIIIAAHDYTYYLAERFYPPLPAEYSDLINAANHIVQNDPGGDTLMEFPADLWPKPKAAFLDGDQYLVTARDLLKAVRLW